MSLNFRLIPSSKKEIMLVRIITGAYNRYLKHGEESLLYRGLELIDLLETEQKNTRELGDQGGERKTRFKDVVIICSARKKLGLEDNDIRVEIREYSDKSVSCERSRSCPIFMSLREICPAINPQLRTPFDIREMGDKEDE